MALSPMMKQYLQMKEQYGDTLLMFRLGDFYEFFFDDAVIAGRELELTLTGRDCGLEERAPMCGVPFHAVDSYIARLIAKGYKVAVCEQLSEPNGKELVKREVVRVVTPGTVIEDAMLQRDRNNYLLSLCYTDGRIGAAWTDISTGEFSFSLLDSMIKLNELLTRLSPSEIICNQEMLTRSVNLSTVKYGAVCPFAFYNEPAYSYENAKLVISEVLTEKVIKTIKDKVCVCAAGALFSYLNSTQKKKIGFVRDGETANACMDIYANARRTLELFESAADSKRKGSLIWVLDKTYTGMGARMLRKWLESPLIDSNKINERLDAVEEIISDKNFISDKLSASLKRILDMERICGRLSYGSIAPKECVALSASLACLPEIKAQLDGIKSPLLRQINDDIDDFSELNALLMSGIDENPSAFLRDGGVIKDGYDALLDDYRTTGRNVKEVLARMEAKEREDTGIKNLKISYNKVFGYYIEVSKTQVPMVPYRYVRKQTLTNGERYITEELKELETKILNAQELALSRETELYAEIMEKIVAYLDRLFVAASAIARLDCLLSFAIVSKESDYCRPIINDDVRQINISEGRHPVVEKLLKDESFVPNNTYLNDSDSRIMLITGPNMAGKSVYMRQVALICIMAHVGCFVPAQKAEICITDKVFTRVGASDDLSSGRSTFMVEMSEVSAILHNATDNSLILLDEVGRGTSTYDGMSIAWSIIEYLSKNIRAKVLFSTHYHELTELEGVLSGIRNYKLTVKEVNNSIVFMRKLMRGSANRSFGIEVAALAGLPDEVVDKAKDLLKRMESLNIAEQTKKCLSVQQLSLFTTPAEAEIIKIIRELDLDNISPRYALDILSDLKEKAEK